MVTPQIPPQITRFWYTFVSLLECLDVAIRPMTDPTLMFSEDERNGYFCILLYSLIDILRVSQEDIQAVRKWAATGHGNAIIKHYAPLLMAFIDGVKDILSIYNREDQVCILEQRHRLVHGPRRGVVEPSRKIHIFDGVVKTEMITNREISDIRIRMLNEHGVEMYITRFRLRLGQKKALFWEIYGGCRVLRHSGIFDRHMENWDQFDPQQMDFQYELSNGNYADTAKVRGDTVMNFYEYCYSSAPTDRPHLDPFVRQMWAAVDSKAGPIRQTYHQLKRHIYMGLVIMIARKVR